MSVQDGDWIDLRQVMIQTFIRAVEEGINLVVVVGDSTSTSKIAPFQQRFPERVVNVGIAEQNLVGVAVGLSLGGFVAVNRGDVKNCYCSGPVQGMLHVGGFVVENEDSIQNCFWDTEATGAFYSDGAIGLPTAAMQDIETYLDARWDRSVWNLPADRVDYPRLSWE